MTHISALRVVQLSDTHLFANDEQALLGLPTYQSLWCVLKQVQQLQPPPDLLLLTGDLSQDETPASYQRLRSLIELLNIPTYWIPGNHDNPAVMQPILATAPFSTHKQFVQGGWNFLLLNSAVPNCVHGELSADTLAWLEEQLQTIDRPTLVTLHHPPVPIASDWMDNINLKNSSALLAVLDRHPQVKLVLFGHIHQAFDQQHEGVRYLGTPSTCVQFRPRSRNFAVDELKPGFRLLTLYPDGSVTTEVERIHECQPLDLAATGY